MKGGQPNLGFRESHWVRNRSSGKPLSGRGDFHVRPDLSHLPGFLCCRKGSGTTGCYQTHRESEEENDGRSEEG